MSANNKNFSSKNNQYSGLFTSLNREYSPGMGQAQQPYEPLTFPKFWTGSFPETVQKEEIMFDCGGSLPGADESFKQAVSEVYERKGIVHISNTGAQSLGDLKPYIDICMEDTMAYEGGANSRGEIEPYFLEVGVPSVSDVHYHHEMAYIGKSTSKIAFSIIDVLGNGRGNTYFSDQVAATEELMTTELGEKLKNKRICYLRNLTDKCEYDNDDESTVYNHWQTSFMTEDPEEAQAIAEASGLEVTWGRDWQGKKRYMKTKYYVDAFEYAPMVDKNVIFASIADHDAWFDTWPGINRLHPKDRHLKMTYGDGEEFKYEEWL
jgi:hypothetical protein